MNSSINDQMTDIYVFIDDFLKAHPTLSNWRRSANSSPLFTDAEVLTIALMQGCIGCATLKQTYNLIARNFASAFPRLCSYKQWIARLHALTPIVGHLICAVPTALHEVDTLFLIDSKPVPVCHPIRHGRVRLMREDGAYFGKTSKGWFFGFKLHTVTTTAGQIVGGVMTPANWDDREAARILSQAIEEGSVVLGDLGYRGPAIIEYMEEEELLILTPADAGERRSRRRMLVSSVKQRVETSFSGLWNRFIDRVYSRSWNGLWNTVKLKMLHFNLCHAGLLSI
jgi:IS5 family transposase